MAIEDDFGYSTPTLRTGPRAFTEYSFNAILVILGLVGSCLSSFGNIFYIFLLLIPVIWSFFGIAALPGIIGLIMIPLGIVQLHYAWKIHSENFTEFQRIIAISWILIILNIISALFMGFMIILAIQFLGAQIFLNVLVVFFLSKEEVQQEFTWESGEY
ncbi:MAG: hypothetical protein ACXAAO_14280 [Candidatus Thorarchaeota archaeon]|jgi:hypothetical protein